MEYKDVSKWSQIPTLSRLGDLKKPPETLYVTQPCDESIFADCVAVVGSRRMTNYGRQVIDKLVPQLVANHKTIISGFMYGVDQYAHHVCNACGGKTIAVLGWGIETPLVDYDKKLAEEIINNHGVLMSEWRSQPATLWTFPIRNRIVAALATDIYVIEAAIKSGSLLTADLGVQLKRQVWAVPGQITSKTSAGTNMLIANGLAKPWLGTMTQPTVFSHDPIVQLIESEPMTASNIARSLKQPISSIGSQLSLLTLTGQLTEKEGTYYLP
jgi:DNA processing protein